MAGRMGRLCSGSKYSDYSLIGNLFPDNYFFLMMAIYLTGIKHPLTAGLCGATIA